MLLVFYTERSLKELFKGPLTFASGLGQTLADNLTGFALAPANTASEPKSKESKGFKIPERCSPRDSFIYFYSNRVVFA